MEFVRVAELFEDDELTDLGDGRVLPEMRASQSLFYADMSTGQSMSPIKSFFSAAPLWSY